jgi:hypothetical protein
MLSQLNCKANQRKSRLLCCACFRHVWHLLESDKLRKAVDSLERFADGEMDPESFQSAVYRVHPLYVYRDELFSGNACEATWSAAYAVHYALRHHIDNQIVCKSLDALQRAVRPPQDNPSSAAARFESLNEEDRFQAAVIHDIFGNPIRRLTLTDSRPSPTVTALADTIYHKRRFEELPILADALEEAGCTSAEILNHCRKGGEHVRGCWVVDLVLGKQKHPKR